MNTRMTMEYEKITPNKAQAYLDTTQNNRRLNPGTVKAYANDMISGNWDEKVSTAIAFDKNGILRDGQHRMAAIIQANRPIAMWVCRGVDDDGIYDVGRTRTSADQMIISCPDLETVYKSSAALSVIRFFIYKNNFRKITFPELRDFIYQHHDILNPFFESISQTTYPKVGIAVVRVAMLTAYCAGVSLEDLQRFYTVLGTGMSESARDFPVIAYRNYLISLDGHARITHDEVKRGQYAIAKYLTNSKSKRSVVPEKPIYPLYPLVLGGQSNDTL